MTKPTISISLALLAALAQTQDTRFATRVVSYSGLGGGVYGDPQAVLGKPTTWVYDHWSGGPNAKVAASLGYAPWNVDPSGNPVITTIAPGGHVTVEFVPPIIRSPKHWYSQDFIVFGNPLLATSTGVAWNTDIGAVSILSGPDFIEPAQVSVSPDGIQWYTYPLDNYHAADGYWPTQAFQWNRATNNWGNESDWTKPVPPNLTRPMLTGKSIADAIDLFKNSAGGTAFSLAPSGFNSVRYVRVSGSWGEVDGFSRVSPSLQTAPALPIN